jgi:hypothetical protein
MTEARKTTAPPAKPKLGERLKKLLEEYGPVAFAVYFGLFFLVLAGFFVAIRMGFAVESAAGSATTIGAAYIATKLTQPVRIVVTLALTPLVARAWRRLRPPPAPDVR